MPARVLQESSTSSLIRLADNSSTRHFTDTSFDPITFLNDSLPSLSLSAFTPDQAQLKHSSLQEASTQTQALLSKVNTQNIRSASQLSQVTEEILRSGNRLAYEVEVLRGYVNSLHESLTDTLLEDIQKFTIAGTATNRRDTGDGNGQPIEHVDSNDPELICQLRMLGQVKARLEKVIKVFGEAMKWPLPPSEVSLTSSLISVSAPEPGSEGHSREEKGRQFAKTAKAEVTELLSDTAGGTDVEGAVTKVDALRLLSTVWKGTAEERARTRFVDNLSRLVEDKRKQVEARSLTQSPQAKDVPGSQPNPTPGKPSVRPTRDSSGNETSGGGGGLFRNLQRLRDEIYLD
jgi:hypothetical protein